MKAQKLSELEKLVLGQDTDELIANIESNKTFDNIVTLPYYIDNNADEPVKLLSTNDNNNPLWYDPDDSNVEINVLKRRKTKRLRKNLNEKSLYGFEIENRLREKFEEINPRPKWADTVTVDENSKNKKFFGNYFETSGKKGTSLAQTKLVYFKDLSGVDAAPSSSINSICFDPSSSFVVTGSDNKNMNLYKLQKKKVKHLKQVEMESFPILCSKFLKEKNEILMSSKRPYLYLYNIETEQVSSKIRIRTRQENRWDKFWVNFESNVIALQGSGGYIPLICSKTKQWIGDMKMNGSFNSGCFSNDGSRFYSFGGDGEVYIWDIGMRKCISKFTDVGCVKGTAIDVSKDEKFIATGSSVGVVNLYQITSNDFSSNSLVKFTKCYNNLTTCINQVRFSPLENCLLFSSRNKNQSVRLLNLDNFNVNSSWQNNNRIGKVTCSDWSLDNKWLVLGTASGKCPLYRIV